MVGLLRRIRTAVRSATWTASVDRRRPLHHGGRDTIRDGRGHGDPEWLPIVVASGATLALLLVDATQAAVLRVDDGLDPNSPGSHFDLTSVTFANIWVALGSIGLASGWAILARPAEPDSAERPVWPRWLGWWALAAGAGLIAARTVWTTYLWLIPYALFWVGLLTLSTRMLRMRPTPIHADAGDEG